MKEAEIKDILSRGVENVYPNYKFVEEALNEAIKSEKPLSFYLGVDPTGPTLHIGHAIVLQKLGKLQKLGHEVTLLIGDLTASIGDPTGKDKTRIPLTTEEIKENYKNYKKQAETFINFGGKNPAKFRFNSEWLGKMKLEDVLKLASHVTVEQMLKRDMFDRRVKNGQPISLHEFMYPLLQGYDSVAMNIDGEIGANDQTFNILMGRQLEKQILGKEKIVIILKLLEDQNGKKMGKTEGNMIALNDNASEMFGKVMSWTDGMILSGFELCTEVSVEDIKQIEKELNDQRKNPKDLKVRLAKEIVKTYHGNELAIKAEQNFFDTFKKGEVPADTEITQVRKGKKLSEVLIEQKLIKSKTEFTKLISEGAIILIEKNEKIANKDFTIDEKGDFKIGKKRFLRIELN